MIPDLLIGNLGDTHLYNNHQDAAFEQMKRESFKLPKLRIKNKKPIDQYTIDDFDVPETADGDQATTPEDDAV